jgi:hypothetical protein
MWSTLSLEPRAGDRTAVGDPPAEPPRTQRERRATRRGPDQCDVSGLRAGGGTATVEHVDQAAGSVIVLMILVPR